MWAYEQRGWGPSDWETLLGERVSTGSMSGRFEAVQDILRHDPKNRKMLDRIDGCGDRFPCQLKYCANCYDRPLDPKRWRVDQESIIADDVLNPVYYSDWVGYGAYRHVQRVQNFLEPFYGLPIDEIAPFTNKFCYLQGGEDYAAVKDWYNKWMRVIGQEFRRIVHPDVKFAYRFEWSFTTAKDAVWDLPLRAPGVADVKNMDPDQVVALFHCHGLGHFPGFTHREAGQFFRMVFDGPSQVHISTPQPDQVAKAYGSWPSLIELEHALSSKLMTTQLPDHPDDAACPHEINSNQPACDASKDHLWDAMADELFGDDDGSNEADGDDDGESGLAGFVCYACKEHLPKAESRYQKLADAKQPQSSTASSGAAASPSPTKTLTPEQMIVAVHADAELKRAFHEKRLTCSFGVQGKARSKDSQAIANTTKEKPSSQNTVLEYHHPNSTCDQSKPIHSAPPPKSETAVHCCGGPFAKDHHHSHQLQTTTSENNKVPYYKEAGRQSFRNPWFTGLIGLWRFTLCLGLRVLRPP